MTTLALLVPRMPIPRPPQPAQVAADVLRSMAYDYATAGQLQQAARFWITGCQHDGRFDA